MVSSSGELLLRCSTRRLERHAPVVEFELFRLLPPPEHGFDDHRDGGRTAITTTDSSVKVDPNDSVDACFRLVPCLAVKRFLPRNCGKYAALARRGAAAVKHLPQRGVNCPLGRL